MPRACIWRAGRRSSGTTRAASVTLDDLTHETTRFLQAKSAAGQASQMVGELDGWLKELKEKQKDTSASTKPIESIDAKLFVDAVDPKLTQFVTDRIKSALAPASGAANAGAGGASAAPRCRRSRSRARR